MHRKVYHGRQGFADAGELRVRHLRLLLGYRACETERGVLSALNQPADCCQGRCVAILAALFTTSLRSPCWVGTCK